MKTLSDLESPGVIIDAKLLNQNLRLMQASCDSNRVELWPHIKTHKMVPLLRRQLELGARGATCAKLGEAEAMMPSGVRRIFIAHSLVDFRKALRLKKLGEQLDELVLAVTSEMHWAVLECLLESVGLTVSILMAVDTGLDREGARTVEQSVALAKKIRSSSRMKLIGIYTHEGHAYGAKSPAEVEVIAEAVYASLIEHANAVGGGITLWPGCSVTAALLAAKPRVQAIRPGSYVFGDLRLSEGAPMKDISENALSILATVVDRPEPGLALIDAGSKVFSSDQTLAGINARCLEFPSLVVARVSEEHGYVSGDAVKEVALGDRLRFVPAHVCPVVNLASKVHVVREDQVIATWPVDARGRSD